MTQHGYRIDINRHAGRVTAHRGECVLAETDRAVILRETRLDDYVYFPIDSVDPILLAPSDHRTFCPFKGTATYWHVGDPASGVRIENGAWAYRSPLPEAAGIDGYLSFSPQVVERYSFAEAPVEGEDYGNISSPLSDWILREAGLCSSRRDLVQQLGRKLVESGVSVYRLNITIWSLHPQIAGANFNWRRDTDTVTVSEPSHDLFSSEQFLNSPVRLVTEGLGGVRQALNVERMEFEFPIMQDLRAEGATDYVAMPLRFSDGQYNSMTLASDDANGFTTADLGLVFECVGVLSRYFEVLTLRTNTMTLLDTYLGPRTGRKVLEGAIRRGYGENIQAVVLYSDLRNSSQLTEDLPRDEYLHLLNRYFEILLEPIAEHGGEVLKFIGDAVLAIFPLAEDAEARIGQASGQALTVQAHNALAAAEGALARCNGEADAGQAAIDFGIALHVGEVTYGNVGGLDRLDFTVIGPAVNLATRIEGLCKTSGNRVLVSSDFRAALAGGSKTDPMSCGAVKSPRFRTLGEHRFPGIAAEQTVFALE